VGELVRASACCGPAGGCSIEEGTRGRIEEVDAGDPLFPYLVSFDGMPRAVWCEPSGLSDYVGPDRYALLVEAAEEFVRRCEGGEEGEAPSVRSYAAFKGALEALKLRA
jgi:hypothetical protein